MLLSRFAYVFNFSMPSRSFSKMSCNFSGQNVLEFWKIRFLITTLDYHRGRLYQYETTLIFYGNIDLSSSSRQKRAFINGTCITHGERKCRKMCLTQTFFSHKFVTHFGQQGCDAGSNSEVEPQALPWTLNFQREKVAIFQFTRYNGNI